MKVREAATVSYVRYGEHEHYGIHTLEMGFNLEAGHQGLGGLSVDPETSGPAMVADICRLFHVSDLDEVKGRTCFVLRCWPTYNEPIEGIEVDGVRWTLTDFQRRHWPDREWDRLAKRTNEIRTEIARHGYEVQRLVGKLETASEGYVDWSRPPQAKGE